MDVLAVLNLGEFAQIFSKMGMFPVFDLAYYIVSILYLKYEPGEQNRTTHKLAFPLWEFEQIFVLLTGLQLDLLMTKLALFTSVETFELQVLIQNKSFCISGLNQVL